MTVRDKKKRASAPVQAPLQPSVVVELGGKKYQLALTFGAIRDAKMALRENGVEINLLRSFSVGAIDADVLPELFFAALRTHHPKISFEEAQALITLKSAGAIVEGVANAFMQSMRDPEAKDGKTDPPREPAT